MDGQIRTEEHIFEMSSCPVLEYHVIETAKWFGLAQTCMMYGIQVIENGKIVAQVEEISADYEKVKKFAGLCNTHRASLCHLQELIHDFFYVG